MLLLTWIAYDESKSLFAQKNALTLQHNLNAARINFEENLKVSKQNTISLAENSSLQGYLRAYENPFGYDAQDNKTQEDFKKEVYRLFRLMLQQNPAYFQVRLIDFKTGYELIRLEQKDKKIFAITEEKLQDKSQAPYVQEIQKNPDELYISEINLNKEFGKIELPFRPTLRIAKVVNTGYGNRGIVVININFAVLMRFDLIRAIKTMNTYITDEQGYYILNTAHPFKEFGKELQNGYKITDDFPQMRSLYATDQQSLEADFDQSLLVAQKIKLSPDKFIVISKHAFNNIFSQNQQEFFIRLFSYTGLITFLVMLTTLVMVNRFIRPIIRLTDYANQVAETKGERQIGKLEIHTHDEVEKLANAFNQMLENLLVSKAEVAAFAEKMEQEVAEKTKELQTLNESLQKKVEEKLAEIRKKDQVLLQQNKMATIGETIGAIAHQWRQPLNALALNIQLLQEMAENGECTPEEMETFVENNMKTINFMSHTIDDFRNFFRESRTKEKFDVKNAVESTLALQSEQLKNHEIFIETQLDEAHLNGYRSKFMQVILNLISNAKDAILQKREEAGDFTGKIHLKLYKEDKCLFIQIEDNGVDVPNELKEKIFEPYFTTKEEGKGTGMGLYMSKEIIHSMGGELSLVYPQGHKTFQIKICKDVS